MSQAVMLRETSAQPARADRVGVRGGLHRGGVGCLVGHAGPGDGGGLGQLPPSAAWRAGGGAEGGQTAPNPTAALDEEWTSNVNPTDR